MGSVLAADKEGDRILVVELSEFLLEGPRDGRRKRPPICFVRQATHRVVSASVSSPDLCRPPSQARVEHQHGLPLRAAQQVERDRRRVEKRRLAQRRLRRLPVP